MAAPADGRGESAAQRPLRGGGRQGAAAVADHHVLRRAGRDREAEGVEGVRDDGDAARIEAQVETRGRTGVEMEALTAVSVAALALYDMIKKADRRAFIERVQLLEKSGGRSGSWKR